MNRIAERGNRNAARHRSIVRSISGLPADTNHSNDLASPTWDDD
jgi:hypothetical protein